MMIKNSFYEKDRIAYYEVDKTMGKELPEELLYTSKGIYEGIKDVYLSYDGDEVFSAAAQSTAECLRSYGAKVTLEIAEGMYHTYAVMPFVKEAQS